ncbi:hypothetical protein [Enterobacter roggenkampii]|uniref:hypothetical protein n=1 Tax=Enterobacter roggenkampii TaxID=1812935 RepID=UPI002FF7D751
MTVNVKQQERLKQRRLKSRNIAPRALAAPVIDGLIQPGNLLPREYDINGMDVLIPEAADRLRPGDTVRVFFGETQVYEEILTDVNFPKTVHIEPVILLTPGLHKVRYEFERVSGGPTIPSDTIDIVIDRRQPGGGALPLALVFPDNLAQTGITPDYLDSHGDQVIATVPDSPGFILEEGMAVHAYVRGANSSELGPVIVFLTADDVSNRTIPVTFNRAIIEAAGEGNAVWDYYFVSRNGYNSARAPKASVAIYLQPVPSDLPAPRVPLFDDDNVIDLADADTPVEIEIDAFKNWDARDRLIATWGSVPLPEVPYNGGIFPVVIKVSRGVVYTVGNGTVGVQYTVYRGNAPFRSPVTNVVVDVKHPGPIDPNPETPENEALVRADVFGGSGNNPVNTLRPDDLGLDARVVVPFYDEAVAGEIITLYWGRPAAREKVTSRAITQAEIDAAAFGDFTVPSAIVDATGTNRQLPVWYTLERAATNPPANAVKAPDTIVDALLSKPGGPDDPEAPFFPEANEKGWLQYETTINGAKVTAPVYVNMQKNDTVQVSWQTYASQNAAPGTEIVGGDWKSDPITVNEPELANGVTVTVPYSVIEVINDVVDDFIGSAVATYEVIQNGGSYTSQDGYVPIDLYPVPRRRRRNIKKTKI